MIAEKDKNPHHNANKRNRKIEIFPNRMNGAFFNTTSMNLGGAKSLFRHNLGKRE